MDLTLAEVAAWCDGTVEPPAAASLRVKGVSTDSRTIQPGELFVAIDGLNMDGHRFVKFVPAAAGVAAVVQKKPGDCGPLPLILVEDTLTALGKIATGYRWHPPLIPWVGITGSNGKTTTRELLSLILSSKWKVRVSKRNWNNFIGLPLSMLGEPADADVAVMELGTNHPGEIARLREILVPTVGVVTSTGQSHLEGFGSAQAVAREKGDIFGWLPPDGMAIFPADDPNTNVLSAAAPHGKLTFSTTGEKADVMAENIRVGHEGSTFTVQGTEVRLPLLGRHNISNCLAAMTAARHLGIGFAEAAKALTRAKSVAGRLQATKTPSGLTVINDTYNANPDSVMAALEVLANFPGKRRIMVLGDMMELGPDSAKLHAEIGTQAGMAELDALFCVGQMTENTAVAAQVNARIVVRLFTSAEALWMSLKEFLRAGDVVLVKGSRGMLMERVANHLLDWFPR